MFRSGIGEDNSETEPRTVLRVPGWTAFTVVGAVIGLLTGVFGIGGSSVATPLIAVLGVPGLLAVASPLPATIPSALAALRPYARRGDVQTTAASWTLLGGVPGVVAGALLSTIVGGPDLLILSGLVLVIVGARVLLPTSGAPSLDRIALSQNRTFVAGLSFAIGLLTGLLANGGGFLLVPMYLLIFGLDMRQAAGTSLLVVTILTIPTLVAHAILGNIDWLVAGAFALGAVPTSLLSALLADKVRGKVLRESFGILLVLCGVAYVSYRLLAH
jgi:uncharacterized protein